MPQTLDSKVVERNWPAVRLQAITPHDTNEIEATRGIYVGGSGNLVVLMAGEPNDAATVTLNNVAQGAFYPISVRRVLTTSSASNLLAAY